MPSHLTRRTLLTSLGAAVGAAACATSRMAAQATPPNPASTVPAGTKLPPVSVPAYEQLARERMTHPAWEFISSGCADDVTVRWNREALERIRIASRVLVDVAHIDTGIKLLGQQLRHPILLAPTATHMLVHKDGELATARGAAAANAIMVASTLSNHPIDVIAKSTEGPVWLQLYVARDRQMTKDLIQRAESSGTKALCLTVDQPVVYARDRVARLGTIGGDLPLGNLPGARGFGNGQTAAIRTRELTWKDLDWFRSIAKTPLFLKGVLHPRDAAQAVQCGVDGIIVSNHGGRALDSVPATIDALPRVVDHVGGKIPVLMDGGIRRGTDVLKALASGASAVLIGRAYLYGLAVNGAEGVRHVVEILRVELETAMALAGRTSIAKIDRSVLWEN